MCQAFWDLCFFQSLFSGILGFSTLRHFRVQGLLGQAFWVSGFFNLKVFVPSFVYFRFVGSKIVGVVDWGVLGSSCCRFPSLRFSESFLGVGFLVFTIFLGAKFRFLLLTVGLFIIIWFRRKTVSEIELLRNFFNACMP